MRPVDSPRPVVHLLSGYIPGDSSRGLRFERLIEGFMSLGFVVKRNDIDWADYTDFDVHHTDIRAQVEMNWGGVKTYYLVTLSGLWMRFFWRHS